MLNYKKISKKLLACLLTFAMMISAFSSVFGIISSALTEGTDFEISSSATVSNSSIVKGIPVVKFYDGTDYSSKNCSSIDKAVDNNVNSGEAEFYYGDGFQFFSMKSGESVDSKNYSSIDTWYLGGERYMDLILSLEDNPSISNILLKNHSNPALMTGSFAIYASDSMETLFNAGNLIKSVDNTTAKQQVYNFSFPAGKELTGKKFVALRMYSPSTDVSEASIGELVSQHGCQIIYPRLMEFNVYGNAQKNEITYTESNTAALPNTLDSIAVSSLEGTFYKDGVATFTGTNDNNSNFAKFIDGDVSGEAQFMKSGDECTFIDVETGVEHSTDGKYHFDLTYTIKDNYSINDIVVINHADTRLRTGKYKLYFSNDKSTLFSNPEKSYLYENVNNTRRQVFELNGDEGYTYKYVGVRIINPVKDIVNFTEFEPRYAVLRVFELNVYGTSTSSSSEIATTVTNDNNTTLPAGDNLVAGMTPETNFYKDNAFSATNFEDINSSISDADPSTMVHTGLRGVSAVAEGSTVKVLTEADGCYTDVIYSLGDSCTISSMLLFNHSTPSIRINEYKLYIADKKADLFKSSSLVGSFKTEGKLRNVVSIDTPIKGAFVALRVTDCMYDKNWPNSAGADAVYLRLADFCVFGTRPVSENRITLASSNNDASCAINKTVAVSSMQQYYINPTNNQREVTSTYTTATDENSVTRTALDVLTDNVMNKEVEFSSAKFATGNGNTFTALYTDGTAALDIVYTLDGRTDISDIVVVNHPHDIWKSSYILYMSDSEATLFDNENIVYTFNNMSLKQRTQHYTAENMSYKYVGMRIVAATTTDDASSVGYGPSAVYPRLYQFNVYGEKSANQGIANVQEADSMAIPSGTSVVTQASAKFYNGSTYEASTVTNGAYLFDGDIATAGNVFSAAANTAMSANDSKYYDLILKLTNTSVVNDIFVFADADPASYPVKYELYASKNSGKLFDAESLISTYENTNSKRAQKFSVPSLSAGYVGIRVHQAGSADNSVLKLLEFNVFGTPGIAVDDSVDAGTNIPADNFLVGAPYTIEYTTKGEKHSRSASNADTLNDGNAVNADWHVGSTASANEFVQKNPETGIWEVVNDGSIYADITFTLGGTATLEKVYVGHHSTPAIRTSWFSVYASDSLSTLYNDANLVKEVKNTGAFRGNVINLDSPLEGIRYIGVRIYDPCSDYSSSVCQLNQSVLNDEKNADHNIYPRLSEIAACGSFEKDPFVVQKVTHLATTKIPSDYNISQDENLSAPLNIKGAFVDTQNASISGLSALKPDALNDGDLTNECLIENKFAYYADGRAYYGSENNRYYLEIRYDLQSPANLKYLVVGNHSSHELVTGYYEVFVGNDYETIYENEPYVVVDNISEYNQGKTSRVNIITFDDSVEPSRHVAVRIWNPVCANGVGSAVCTETVNNIYTRLFEFSVYGEYEDPNFAPKEPEALTDTQGFDLSTIKDIYGPNLIENSALNFGIDGTKKSKTVESQKWINKLTEYIKDGTGTMHADLEGGLGEHTLDGKPLDLYWKLSMPDTKPDIIKVHGFAFQGISSDSTPYYTSHYAVYVAEEQEDLWLDSSRVFVYNATNGENRIQKGVIYEFSKDKEIAGNYVGLRIYNGVYTATQYKYPRISFFHVWGEEGVVKGYPGNLAENMPINPSLVSGKDKTIISEENLTAKEVANLTDSNEETSAKITTNGKDVEMLYNLCGDMKIDSIWASVVNSGKSGFKTMKVYAANSIAEVNSESSLIWTYKAKSGTVKPTKTFKKQLKARYIRFVFEDTKDTLVINELYVNGLDNQKNKTRNLTTNSSASDLTFTKVENATGSSSYINPPNIERILDGDASSYVEIRDGGIVGKHSYNIELQFTDLRTISQIKFNFLKYFKEYRPKTINVYIGETHEDIFPVEGKATPNFVVKVKDTNENGVWSKQIRPVLGRYVRVEIVDFNKNELYINEEGEQEIVTILSDIIVIGTKVKGMNADETTQTLIELDDSNGKGGVIVNRLDLNDIFTDAVSVKLTPEKATNWQMRGLQRVPYLKVVDKTVYKVEIFDLYGNAVKDFGGRTLTVKLKLPKGVDGSSYMIGDASDRTKMIGLDSFALEGYIYANCSLDPTKDNKIALLEMTTENDPYWDTIGELEDFSEGVWVNPEDQYWQELYPNSIITKDKRFVVTGVMEDLKNGSKFVATDISYTVDESVLAAALEAVSDDPTKVVAVAYDMELFQDGNYYDLSGNCVDVTMYLPSFLYDNYTGFRIVHVDDSGIARELWGEVDFMDDSIYRFQTDSFSKFVLLATLNDGDFIYTDTNTGVSPETGETVGSVAAALLCLAAAAYVAMNFARKREEEN